MPPVNQGSRTALITWTVVTSLAHFWFNAFFEGGHTGADSGIFEIDWEAMDVDAIDRLFLRFASTPRPLLLGNANHMDVNAGLCECLGLPSNTRVT